MRFKGPKKPAVAPLLSVDPEYRQPLPLRGRYCVVSGRFSRLINPVCSWRCSSSAQFHRLFVGVGDHQTYFNESIPDLGENRDGRRKYREIDTRLKRLRWVNRELRKEYGGSEGSMRNWLLEPGSAHRQGALLEDGR